MEKYQVSIGDKQSCCQLTKINEHASMEQARLDPGPSPLREDLLQHLSQTTASGSFHFTSGESLV